jgi:inosine/xanthosine triphosphate pyrophosphatase family protein
MTERERMLQLMEAVDEFRQAVNATVQGLVTDGFTDAQARDIVAGFWRQAGRKEETDG